MTKLRRVEFLGAIVELVGGGGWVTQNVKVFKAKNRPSMYNFFSQFTDSHT